MKNDPLAVTDIELSREDDSRLIQLSREYLQLLEEGKEPDRNALIARYPELREDAVECLDGIDLAFSLRKGNQYQVGPASQELGSSLEPLGDFRIVREIGRGGMGVVYEAFQLSLARSVALKVLPFAAALDDRHRKRFLIEAQSAAQLHHNNIVPVYAVGCERGTHFYAMQLINGQPISAALFDELSKSPNALNMSFENSSTIIEGNEITVPCASVRSVSSRTLLRDRNRIIAAMIAQAADALEYAHSCGVVHRDVKPGNLLLDVKGKIWITDFGLAQIATSDQVTQTGDLLGTLRYMSPEQASGHRGVVDHRSDVYSLGATLYEMLTREPIFDGADRQKLLHQILNDDPRPLRKKDRTIPEELETITLKALRHAPSDRYESAKALADDLRRFLAETPILARRPTVIDTTRKWMRRHPSTVLSLLFSLVAALVSLAVVTATIQSSLQREEQRAIQAEQRLAIAQAAADEMIRMAENELSISPMEEALRQRLLTSALKYYQDLIIATAEDTGLQASLRATRDRAARILTELTLARADRSVQLLSNASVQRELGLSTEQIAQLASTTSSHGAKLGDADFFSEAQRRESLVKQILTPEQLQRLKQLSLQLQGPPALRDLVIMGELQLTPEQTMAIQNDIQSFLNEYLGSTLAHDSPENEISRSLAAIVIPSDDFIRPEIKAKLMERLLKRLTPDQRNKWREVTGEKFGAK